MNTIVDVALAVKIRDRYDISIGQHSLVDFFACCPT